MSLRDSKARSRSFSVVFQTNGGSDVSTQTVEANGYAVRPLDPIRASYRFGGWFSDAACTQAYDFDTPVTGDLILYAKWTSISNSNSSSSSNSSDNTGNSQTTTTINPDGSYTTIVTKPDGTITETTNMADGSSTVIQTDKDGTVTTINTDEANNVTKVVEYTDGSSQTTINNADGTSSITTVTEDGRVTAEVRLTDTIVNNAVEENTTVLLSMPDISVSNDQRNAPTVTVELPTSYSVKVEVPVKNATMGTVAVIVKPNGTEEIIKTSVITENGVSITLTDGDTVKFIDNTKQFEDVSNNHWAADAVTFATSRELFNGTSAITFAPATIMSRAMIVTVLARFEGTDTSTADIWYHAGQQWAVENGVSDGTNMEQPLTREQLVTMLWRYVGSPVANGDISAYPDGDDIRAWAMDAMTWAVEQGLIRGNGTGAIAPQEQVSRAEVATILMRFIENM